MLLEKSSFDRSIALVHARLFINTTLRLAHSLTCFKACPCNNKLFDIVLLLCLKTILQDLSTLILRDNFSSLGASVSSINCNAFSVGASSAISSA